MSGLLSERETEVMDRLVTGASNRQIAQCLYMSESTVKSHLRNIAARLLWSERHSRTELVSWYLGYRYGLLRGAAQAVVQAGPSERDAAVDTLRRALAILDPA